MTWKQAETSILSNGIKTLLALIDIDVHGPTGAPLNVNWFIFQADDHWNLTLLHKGSASSASAAKTFSEDFVLKSFS